MLSLLLLAGLSGPSTDVSASLDDLATLDHAGLTAAVDALAIAHPHVTKSLVGRSRTERTIEALTLAPAGAAADRPALLLVAGLTGGEAFSSTLALHHARALAKGYGSHEGATALLDACTVHVIPRANPDAIEAFFGTPRREGHATGFGVDDDRDGVQGEDPLQDVDGDGLITWMRYQDPEGTWLPDPTDGRALLEADRSKGERGAWKLVREARDLDGDESTGEDGPLNAVVNRNFPAGWEEHEADVGLWPTDEPEVRALIEFVLARKNLVTVVVYDAQDNLVEAPKSVDDDARAVQRIPPSGYRKSDAEHLERIAERYRETTGNETKGAAESAGSFQRWAYEHRGLLTLCARPWDLPLEPPAEPEESDEPADSEGEDAGEEPALAADEAEDAEPEEPEEPEAEPSDDAKRLLWIDANADEAWRFDPWTAFEHPELGPVEIGGFVALAHTEPPADARQELADKHLEWFVTLVDDLPRLAIARFEKERVGDGLWRVELVLENSGRLPLRTKSAELTRTIRPARVRLLLPEAATLLAGELQQLAGDLGPVDGRFEATWLVQAPNAAEIGIEIDTDHAGDLNTLAEVKQ